MTSAASLLSSPPTVARAPLCHRYLEKITTLGEDTAAAWFRKDARRPTEVMRLLAEFEATFGDGYDPAPFVQELRSLGGIDQDLRVRLLDALGDEYGRRFRPAERLAACRAAATDFREAFDGWHGRMLNPDAGPDSAALWETLLERTAELLRLLSDPELRCRWIP